MPIRQRKVAEPNSTHVLIQLGAIFEVPINADGEYDIHPIIERAKELLLPLESHAGFIDLGSAHMTYLSSEEGAHQCKRCGRWATDWLSQSSVNGLPPGKQHPHGFFCASCEPISCEE